MENLNFTSNTKFCIKCCVEESLSIFFTFLEVSFQFNSISNKGILNYSQWVLLDTVKDCSLEYEKFREIL